jgi:hypothetical protein
VKVTLSPAQMILSLFATPEISTAVSAPVGNAFTVITTGPKLDIHPFELVTSTVIDAPLVRVVLMKILEALFWTLKPFRLKL